MNSRKAIAKYGYEACLRGVAAAERLQNNETHEGSYYWAKIMLSDADEHDEDEDPEFPPSHIRAIDNRHRYLGGNNEGIMEYPRPTTGMRVSEIANQLDIPMSAAVSALAAYARIAYSVDFYSATAWARNLADENLGLSGEEIQAIINRHLPKPNRAHHD